MRGGKRAGAGRPAGTANRRTREIANQAAAEGVTPLEVMLGNMRFFHTEAGELLQKIMAPDAADKDKAVELFKALMATREKAEDCARDAAPYIHPRLTATTIKGEGENGAIQLVWLAA